MELEERIVELEARERLRELRHAYAAHLDGREWEAWVELFAEDATCEFAGWGTVSGRDELLSFARDVVADTFVYSAHVLHQPILHVDGDVATGRWYVEVYDARTDGTAGWRQGTYRDRYRRVDGTWLFDEVAAAFVARQRLGEHATEETRHGTMIDLTGG